MQTPQSGREYFDLGNRFMIDNRMAEALVAFENAARLEPKQSAIPANMGKVLSVMGRIDEARFAYDRAIALEKPNASTYDYQRALLQPVIYDSKEQILQERSRLNNSLKKLAASKIKFKDPEKSVGNPAFFLAYQGLNNRETQIAIADVLERACPSLKYRAEFGKHPSRTKIRVGIFSAHFYEHTIGRVNLGVFRNLPRDKFEVILIRPHGSRDQVTVDLEAAADSVMVVPPDLEAARMHIENAELDVLLFADIGMEPLSYYLAFARLAPVQAVLWGHPDTTGIRNVDYYVSTKSFEPPDAQDAYSERLIQLPRHYMCYDIPAVPVTKLPKAAFGASDNEKIYLCPQSLFKLHPDSDAYFDAILKKDPNGVICLPEGPFDIWTSRLKKRFAKSCPDTANRIRFIPRIETKQFRDALFSTDVIIDPMHFTGGYTSYLGLSVGTPIVTVRGEFLRGRMTSGLYHQMGIDSLIAQNAEDYAEIASRVANDAEWKREQMKQIEGSRSEIFNDSRGIVYLTEFLVAAHEASKTRDLVRYD